MRIIGGLEMVRCTSNKMVGKSGGLEMVLYNITNR